MGNGAKPLASDSGFELTVEHVGGTQAAASLARAYDLILRAADPAATTAPPSRLSVMPAGHGGARDG